jgi:hypothetical protein
VTGPEIEAVMCDRAGNPSGKIQKNKALGGEKREGVAEMSRGFCHALGNSV